MIKTVLLTGATGFLGSHITRALVEEGYNIVILKRSFSNTFRIKTIINEIKFYDIDKVDLEIPFKENKIDCIIHTATSYGRKGEKPSEILEVNLNFSLKLLEIATSFDTKVFLNADTYINKNVAIYKYLSYYSLSKKQFVEWLKLFQDKIKIFNLKLEYIYGEADDFSKFVPYVIRELLLKVNEIKLTKGEQRRDFIYVGDVVNAYKTILSRAYNFSNGFYEYEVGTGKSISIRDLVLLIKKITDNNETYLNFGAIPYRENEIMESKADISKLKEDFNWEPKVSLEEGLKRTIEWYKNNLGNWYV